MDKHARMALSTLVVLQLAATAYAKFETVYQELGQLGLDICVANSSFTYQNITLKDNCRDGLTCILAPLDNRLLGNMSAGAAILALIPTIIQFLGNTNEEITVLHARFPILAFLLSITNPNRDNGRLTWYNKSSEKNTTMGSISLGRYGTIRAVSPIEKLRKEERFWLVVLHILVAACAAAVIWQTVDLGRKGVVIWACWTSFYPAIWLAAGILQHVLAVLFLRISLRPSVAYGGAAAHVPRTALFIPILAHSPCDFEVVAPWLEHWTKQGVSLFGNAVYVLGTIFIGSLTLVDAVSAIKVLAVYAIISAFSRVVASYALSKVKFDDKSS